MFQLHTGNMQHTLTLQDFRYLGEVTERYSGSDIATVVRDALMQPVRKVQTATHFKRVSAPDRTNPSKTRQHWSPCSPGDPAAKEMRWTDIEGDDLLEPTLCLQDFVKSLQTVRPSVSDADIGRACQIHGRIWTGGMMDGIHVAVQIQINDTSYTSSFIMTCVYDGSLKNYFI